MEPADAQPVWLFWDGACGLCRRAVVWVKHHDVTNQIRAVPYQDAPRPPMTDSLARRCERAVHVFTPDGQVLSAGRASLYVLGEGGVPAPGLGGPSAALCVEGLNWAIGSSRGIDSFLVSGCFQKNRCSRTGSC